MPGENGRSSFVIPGHRSTKRIPNGEERVTYDVEMDTEAIVTRIGYSAASNKSGRSTILGGQVRAKVVSRACGLGPGVELPHLEARPHAAPSADDSRYRLEPDSIIGPPKRARRKSALRDRL